MSIKPGFRKIYTFFSPRVQGRPKCEAHFVEQGLCRFRWLAIVWPVLALLNWFALMEYKQAGMTLAHAFMVAPIALVLFSGNCFSIPRARWILFITVGCVLAGAGIAQGISLFDPALAGFGFAYALLLGLAPLPIGALIVLLCTGLGSAAASALLALSGSHLPAFSHIGSMMSAVVLGVIGISMNRWSHRNHRVMTISRLRLLRQSAEIERQRHRADQLLERALTPFVAQELRRHKLFPPSTAEVCVIEADIVGFSAYCETMPVGVVLHQLQRFSRTFDKCCLEHSVEPLHAWGDASMAVAGLKRDSAGLHSLPEVDCALAMLALCRRMTRVDALDAENKNIWPARIGIHCGPVMMAVMDGARLRFDIWGETVNIAARLEQGSRPSRIQVSEKFLLATRGLFDHGPIQNVQIKQTLVSAAELEGIKAEYEDGQGNPNDLFWSIYHDSDCGVYSPDPNGTRRIIQPAAS
jgi:class 3 adenylate cyclase